jgi:hypothetical protein
MTTKINVTRGEYGFGHNWTLEISTPKEAKSFFLGQDIKFCNRVLNMDPRYVVDRIGTSEIDNGTKGNRLLAKFICEYLNINGRNFKKINAWELCAQ